MHPYTVKVLDAEGVEHILPAQSVTPAERTTGAGIRQMPS